MDRFRLKNIIIFILVMLNVFLLVLILQRREAEQEAFRRTAEQLVALFQEDGMTLDLRAISRDVPPESVTLTRDTALEERAASFLLGKSLSSSDQGGGIYHYSGAAGESFFRAGGSFEASGVLASRDVEDFCRDFCREFSYDPPDIQLDDDGNGVFSAVCLRDRLPVFNCSVIFVIENHVLTSVSGVILPEAGEPAVGTEEPLTAAGALLAFQRMRRESAVVASTVTDTRLCYELQSGGGLTLAPVWRIVTDTEDYYVNCCTAAVSAGGAPGVESVS